MNNRVLKIGLMLICLSTMASATSILWVSDCWNEATPHDRGFIERLTAEGYTVARMQDPQVMTEAKRNEANGYDLVIVGRHGASGNYINTGEVALWNSITKPMINMNPYVWRSGHWKWFNATGITNPNVSDNMLVIDKTSPVFAKVTLDANDQVDVISQGIMSMLQITNAGNGKILATRAVTGGQWVWIAQWTTGTEFYAGSGQFATAPRMAFATSEAGGSGDGFYNLTEEGGKMFSNAVYLMSGATFNRFPVANAGTDFIVYVEDTIQPVGTVFDPDTETVAIEWSKLDGPGIVTFSDAAVLNPVVSFSVKGTYTLQMQANDGDNTVKDTITVYVRDHADDKMLSHWDFEGLPDPNTLVDIENGFNGDFHHIVAGSEPNVISGHMSDTAVNFNSVQYWEVPNTLTGDPNGNYNTTRTGLSVAAWAKVEGEGGGPSPSTPMLIGYNTAGWRFQINANRWNLVQSGGTQREVFSVRQVFRPAWQHVVGVFDGPNHQMKIYIDGILDTTADMPAGYTLGTGTLPLQIGNRADAERMWPGMVDDIRVYNYALSDTEILALAAGGDKAPLITAGPDQTVFYKGVPVPMDATLLIDDGVPAPLSLTWSVAQVPTGVDPASVTFTDTAAEDPGVTFPTVPGIYVLRLAATDGVYNLMDEITVSLTIPTCENVLTDGLGMAADLSGPNGTPDCYINIYDFAVIANNWLECNNPADADCFFPY
ncbi:MAG: LamG-like jellyroll fold domain-containing protein [Anaerohalosphaeraceae bacterium]